MDLDKYIEDYYLTKVKEKDILEKEGVTRYQFNKQMKERGYPKTSEIYRRLNLGNPELERNIKEKYNNISKRCNNLSYESSRIYDDMEYLPLYEWIEFSQSKKELLLEMWDRYIASDKDMRLAVSVDRIDDNKGYFKDNLQFVTHGFNSFKRNIKPVKVTHKGESKFFMSAKEAGRSYGIREQSLSDMLSGIYREISKEFDIEESDVETVLKENNLNSLEKYYEDKYL